jgi:dTDP-4-dehydrorhamnose reductase
LSNSNPVSLKILLTGSQGQVGFELLRTLASVGNIIAFDHEKLDLTNNDQIRNTVRELRPDVIVNAAAYTAVDRAESEPEVALQVNAIAPGILAEEAKRIGSLLVHYSTDYVFDGSKRDPYTEEDAPNPLNVYGKSKLEGERAIQATGAHFYIFRTSWVYGARGQNFLLTILRLAQTRDELRIVDDQFGAPTWSRTIAEITASALQQIAGKDQQARGLFHVAAGGMTTWRRFAQQAFDRLGLSTRIIPIKTAEYPTVASRPSNSILATDKLRTSFDVELPRWESALDLVLSELELRPG